MLILPIKKQWYDMILSGEKIEEYREIKPYYRSRFIGANLLKALVDPLDNSERIVPNGSSWVLFRNGYAKTSPTIAALCSVTEGSGNAKWGASPGERYYILHIEKIERDWKRYEQLY